MSIILAILIYLNVLVPGDTYTQSYICTTINDLMPQIELIEEDPGQMNIVDDVYVPQVPSITILTDGIW